MQERRVVASWHTVTFTANYIYTGPNQDSRRLGIDTVTEACLNGT